ncbi:hypothetical protein CLV59_101650 [Chitinophaga dinghuensis]|uniref:Sugar lactone lactonase YvrE n=1 Tax=Chitinophaga dinghuensis TaxID=1539050 RepID=A0A327WBI6_9BACT|nr:hypothetical protein [Chitinophaga dinghuensis]RAJ87885.1 hypothetical protein CLV59_101650 [Chitinophaga dinghuensis]
MKHYITKALLLLAGAVYTQTSQAQQLNSSKFMKTPESIIPFQQGYFITDLGAGGDPSAKDGNGVIWKMDKKGQGTVFATGLDAPKGTAIVGHTLYVADVDKVKGFDVSTGKQIFTLDFSATGTLLLNDLTKKDEHTLFVSASDINKIFTIHLDAGGSYEALKLQSDVRGANGLTYDATSGRLYACGFGSLKTQDGLIGYIDLKKQPDTFIPLSERKGFYDGIEMTANKKQLVISDWVSFEKKGILLLLDIASGKITTVKAPLMNGPADFTLSGNTAIVPAFLDADILRIPLN